jgi:hypothetical protein
VRVSARLAFASLVFCLAPIASAQPLFVSSPYLERIPDPGPCDVVVTPVDAAEGLARANDAGVRVICVAPGDYRSFGMLRLDASGTPSARRYLRYDTSHFDATTAVQRSERARFESLRIRGSWWVVQGLTVQPRDPVTQYFVTIDGGDHVVVDGCLIATDPRTRIPRRRRGS